MLFFVSLLLLLPIRAGLGQAPDEFFHVWKGDGGEQVQVSNDGREVLVLLLVKLLDEYGKFLGAWHD